MANLVILEISRDDINRLQGVPDVCPICNRLGAPNVVYGRHTGTPENPRLDVVFNCTSGHCKALFVGYYQLSDIPNKKWELMKSIGPIIQKPTIPDSVVQLSAEFAEIFTEAFAAESLGLNNISGVGLRKALEFLVKDFASHVTESPEEQGEILAMPLAKVINRHIADPHARAVASRAVWLGNDETHYVRVWADKDRADLKELIRLTISWIASYLAGEKYLKEMPDKL